MKDALISKGKMVELRNEGKNERNIMRQQFIVGTKYRPQESLMLNEEDFHKMASDKNLKLSGRIEAYLLIELDVNLVPLSTSANHESSPLIGCQRKGTKLTSRSISK